MHANVKISNGIFFVVCMSVSIGEWICVNGVDNFEVNIGIINTWMKYLLVTVTRNDNINSYILFKSTIIMLQGIDLINIFINERY